MRNQFAYNRFSQFSWFEKILLITSAGFVYLAIFQGAEAALFWMPKNWGSYDEDGEFISLASELAGFLSFILGSSLVSSLLYASKSYFDMSSMWNEIDSLKVKAFELERIAKLRKDETNFDFLKNEYQRKIASSVDGFVETFVQGTRRRVPLSLYQDLLHYL